MEIKEFKVPLYKDEQGNEFISTKNITDEINNEGRKESNYFDRIDMQGRVKKDNIIALSSYKTNTDDEDEIMPFEEEPTLEEELKSILSKLKRCIKDGTRITSVKKENDRGKSR